MNRIRSLCLAAIFLASATLVSLVGLAQDPPVWYTIDDWVRPHCMAGSPPPASDETGLTYVSAEDLGVMLAIHDDRIVGVYFATITTCNALAEKYARRWLVDRT